MRSVSGSWGIVLSLGLAVGGGVLACADTGDGTGASGVDPVPEAPRRQVMADEFVGSEACQGCHAVQYDQWSASTHGRAGGEPGPDLVIAPFDGSPIRFRDATVVPAVQADGGYAFTVRQDQRPERTFTVDGVIGGGHMLGGGTQGFVSRMDDGTVRFLPFDYSRQLGDWFCNTGSRAEQGWVPVSPDMALADCGDWPPVRVLGALPRFANCQSCHGSQIEAALAPGEGVSTRWTSLSVNCESCHGPARDHVQWAEEGALGEAIGLEPRSTDDVAESLNVCFQCHALKDVVEEGYLPGERLEDHYALKLPVLGDDPYLPDGRVKTFAYQATHLSSACYLDGSMTCVSCHEPHGQGYWDVNRRPLPDELDDGQCTSCHGAKRVDPEAHTHHDAASPGGRCVSCHMPYLQHPEVGDDVPFARSDHTIPIPRPAHDARSGLVSACRSCHGDRSEILLQNQVDQWWGELKPHDPIVGGMLAVTDAMSQEQAARMLLRPDQDRPLAQFQALARFLTGWVEPGAALTPEAHERIGLLARAPDPELRALAQSTLRVAGDTVSGSGEPPSPPVRRRMGMILSYLGDEAAARGDGREALRLYGLALDVLPEDPTVLRSLGIALNQSGELEEARRVFARSLAADPNQPLVYVNQGIAQAASGDPGGAIRSYESALEVDPNEALAYFNLGNVHLRGGNLPQAIAAYERAVSLAPGLGQAHLNLGLALIRAQRFDEALPHARQAVEFSPESETARQMLADLERAVGGG